MKNARRILVGLLATAMAIGTPMSVSAADITGATSGGLTGTGGVEGSVNTDVIKVVLPTTSLNFSIDPQGLLVKTEGIKNKGKLEYTTTFKKDGQDCTKDDTGLVFFSNPTLGSDGKTISNMEYTNTLNLDVVNKSACNVSITPSISAVVPDGVTLNTSGTFTADSEKPEIYLGLTYMGSSSSEKTICADSSNDKLGSPVEVKGVPGAYVYGYNKVYTYTLNEELLKDDGTEGTDKPMTTTFKLSAKCNTNAGWGDVAKSKTKPSVKVTWNVAKASSTT